MLTVAGENLADAIQAIRALNRKGITASFDHLGESIASEGEAREEVNEYLQVLGSISQEMLDSNVSVKLSQLGLDINAGLCLDNTRAIVEAAMSAPFRFHLRTLDETDIAHRT